MSPLVSAIVIGIVVGAVIGVVVGLLLNFVGFNIFKRLAARKSRRAF
jgi:NhaP-type Na+/H+ or K+/H+ antiporter